MSKQTKKLSDILTKAADLISEHDGRRWITGKWMAKNKGLNCYCAEGAILAAAGLDYKHPHRETERRMIDECAMVAKRAMSRLKSSRWTRIKAYFKYSGTPSLNTFNDSQTSYKPVETVLRKAAAQAAREGN